MFNMVNALSTVNKLLVLLSRIFSLADVMVQALRSNLSQMISPEVASDLLWFLQCWTTAYLFTEETSETKLPDLFKNAFGKSCACAKQLVGLILDTAETHLVCLSSEKTVAEDSVQLLLKLVLSESR